MKEQKKPKDYAENRKFTPQVQNPKVEALLELYRKEQSGENLRQLVEALGSARLLVPANLNKNQQPVPCLIDTPEGGRLFSAYTCMERIPRASMNTVIVNMSFPAVSEMVTRPQSPVEGLILNPFTDNLVLTQSLLRRVRELEARRADGVSYEASERRRFETAFLPERFFALGKAMIEELCGEKEAYIDRLFEEAYEQKRMYPYLPENFAVMVMNISEDLLLIRVDLPDRDLGETFCEHVYLAWNEAEGSGRYFMIERERATKRRTLGEVSDNGCRADYGEAPVEGTELQRIIDIVRENKKEI